MNLQIENPCPENWDAMTPDASGRHCAVCAKSVHDFTNKPKEELLAFLLCSTQSPCVRMLTSQGSFTPEEVQATAQKLIHSGMAIPAAALALVMLLATGCRTDGQANAPRDKDTVSRKMATGMVLSPLPPTDIPTGCGVEGPPPMIMGKMISAPECPEKAVPETPFVMGEPVFMGAPPMPAPPSAAPDTQLMGDVTMPEAK